MNRKLMGQSGPVPLNPEEFARICQGPYFGAEQETARPIFPKLNRRETRRQIEEILLHLCLEHPEWSCDRLTRELDEMNVAVSSNMVYSMLVARQMSNKRERLAKLEEILAEDDGALSPQQAALLESKNVWFKERYSRGGKPGEVLVQDTAYAGKLKSLGDIYLQSVLDTYSGYTFSMVNTDNRPQHSVAILRNEALPFFRRLGLPVIRVVTGKGREYYGKTDHIYRVFLKLQGIEHLRPYAAHFSSHSFIGRFHDIAGSEFFQKINLARPYECVAELQAEFTDWLYRYNRYPIQGYPKMGQTSLDSLRNYLEKDKSRIPIF